MATPIAGNGSATRLYFGSAVLPTRTKSGEARMSAAFTALLGFHRLYSRLLLAAAVARLSRSGPRR
jgi:hypothetical protein